ncbi:unnamed protein product [Spirodela intermedia]|uniref:Uncharacterized protein n=2 Tax=Spirodela intermedia TaxID=51605 RepID=A0A7I8JHK9_SPIIN|nr:unnamed protein product [Spirodela intermedia]CAA6669235.1 unnamed protein product [Spirodela intermedia]CAA7406182.1 unnamed protein product [Spirodela intermedia]
MGRHHHHSCRDCGSDSPYDDPFLACCCCPCFVLTFLFRGIGRCLFVAFHPVLRCFGLDEHRHHHHHHHHHDHFH